MSNTKTYGMNGWSYWYDRQTKCWWATFDTDVQREGINAYTKAEIEYAINGELV